MKRAILIAGVLLGLAAAALIAPMLLSDPGHVVLDIGRWRLEMTLLTLVGAVLLVWIALSLVIGVLRLPARLRRRARAARARRRMETGLLALTEGDWPRAEKALEKSLHTRQSTAGFLAAARAAQGRGDISRRDRWLAMADARWGRRHFVTGLARARLKISEGRLEEALEQLETLHLKKPRHTGVLRLLLETYQELDRWRDLRLLAPALKRAGVVDRERARELAVFAGVRELQACTGIEALEASWREMDRHLRRRHELIEAYARRAGELGRHALAGNLLRKHLQSQPDPALLRLYAEADDEERGRRIRDCEKWLVDNPDQPDVQLALGLLYLDQREYDKSQACLERSLQERPDSEAYAALGRVLDRAGDLEGAARCYRNALRLKNGRGAEPLPGPAPRPGLSAQS